MTVITRRTISDDALLDALRLHPVPAGTVTLGIEDSVFQRFTKSYGEFWDEFFGREIPQHQVPVAAFDLGRYPVTNAIYAMFMADSGYDDPAFWTPDGWAWRQHTNRTAPLHWGEEQFAGDERPVVGVSWFEASAVAAWASARTGHPIRLPSEAEWEWAAHADNTRSSYPWGGAFDPKRLNSGYSDEKHTAIGSTVNVGTFSPAGDGPFGHSDMIGQVWEWTNSAFRPYPFDAADGREDRYVPWPRVLRGGNWADGKYVNRVTTRYYFPANYADKTDGFRLAMGGGAAPIATRPGMDLVMYGRSTFCPDLQRARRWLHQWNVPYRQINTDLDETAAHRLDAWLGSRTVPTIVVAEYAQVEPYASPAEVDVRHLRNQDRGSMLHEPDEETLRAFLMRHGMLNGHG